MSAIPATEIAGWLESRGDGDAETLVYNPSDTTFATNERESNLFSFLLAYTNLVTQLGDPDFPFACDHDWRETLGFPSDVAAVWNFDYYQLSLRIRSSDGALLLAKHTP